MDNIIHGDCLVVMAGLGPNSVDSIVTDPPYGLAFMGKGWDHGIPGIPFWAEALRVARPGCYLLAFGGTRTFHRLACAIEDAGWEIRDTLMWVYGSGFPKSHDVSKAIDKAAGKEREVVGPGQYHCEGRTKAMGTNGIYGGPPKDMVGDGKWETAPATDAARQWEGWGTALKPAYEPIILARKPLEGTVAENVQKWGTGAINVDGCRVETKPRLTGTKNPLASSGSGNCYLGSDGKKQIAYDANPPSGRWPANLIHDGSEEVLELFPETATNSHGKSVGAGLLTKNTKAIVYGEFARRVYQNETADSGSAARFFYCAKASKEERNRGCERLEAKFSPTMGNGIGGKEPDPETATKKRNHHPTVKPLALMRYLCRLVTPPNGLVLDPFMGSGTTGMAAKMEGFQFIGIEKEKEYVEIAERRIGAVQAPLL